MKRMLEVKDVASEGGLLVGDVRVRVDLAALAKELGPTAIMKRGHQVNLYGGALIVEAFNIREVKHEV